MANSYIGVVRGCDNVSNPNLEHIDTYMINLAKQYNITLIIVDIAQ